MFKRLDRLKDQRMVEEQEVGALLFRLLEDLWQRRQRDQDLAHLRRRVADLQAAVVPPLGQGQRGNKLDRIRNVFNAYQGPGIVQSPDREPPQGWPNSSRGQPAFRCSPFRCSWR